MGFQTDMRQGVEEGEKPNFVNAMAGFDTDIGIEGMAVAEDIGCIAAAAAAGTQEGQVVARELKLNFANWKIG